MTMPGLHERFFVSGWTSSSSSLLAFSASADACPQRELVISGKFEFRPEHPLFPAWRFDPLTAETIHGGPVDRRAVEVAL
jgi:hypothetical protein